MIENYGTITHTYDLANRHTSCHSPYFSQKILKQDPLGNILQSQYNNETLSYTYDDLSQLTSEKDHTYTYDPYHNRTQKDHTIYTINSLNQIPSHFIYNLDGNPISYQNAHFTYDAFDRLIIYEDENTYITYTYDSFHRRISKTQNGQATYYLYDDQNEIGSTDSSYTIQELRILGRTPNAEIASAIALELHGKLFAPLHDLHGNLATILSQNFREDYRYTAFGEPYTTSSLSPWRFSSKRHDPESGFIYFGRRYYLPTFGRWLTPDPLGFDAGPNFYAFVSNCPLTHIDCYGLLESVHNSTPYAKSNSNLLNFFRNCHFRDPFQVIRSPVIETINYFSATIANNGLSNSKLYQVGDFDLPNGAILFINGINNTQNNAMTSAKQLSQYAGGAKIYGIYNATNGDSNGDNIRLASIAIDIVECGLGHMGIHTPPVQLLKNQWNHLIATHKPEEKFMQLSHSEGSLDVYHALSTSPPSVQQRIISVAFAPAVIIPKSLCFESFNYVSKRDFVTHLDIIGKIKYGNQLQMLDPHPNAKLWDHEFLSPTFKDQIEHHINNYIENYCGKK
jgi:RHS repeat-associated protein